MPCRPGETAAAYFRRRKQLSLASRRGVERAEGRRWVKAPLSYVCRPGDRLRVAASEDPGVLGPLVEALQRVGVKL